MNCGGTIHVNRNAIIIMVSVGLLLFVFYGYSENENKNSFEFVNLKELLSVAIDAAQRGGVKVYEVRERRTSIDARSKGKTKEGANDPVTDGDMQSHIEMYQSIKRAFPGITIISEEKSSNNDDNIIISPANIHVKELKNLKINDEFVQAKDIQIWIDPLDATQEYTENLRQYVTTMVCVAVRGKPVIGVIHKPFEEFTAWAWVNQSSSSELIVPKSNEVFPADKAVRVIVSRSHKGSVEETVKNTFGVETVITSAGGAGYKTLEVLNGNQDVYFHSTLIKKWDICAGNAILNHFKGRMTTLKGKDITYNSSVDYKNPDGILATLYNYGFYLKKVQKL